MWDLFFLACAICILMLYLPGYLFFRLARINQFCSVALSPIYSLFCFGVFGLVFQCLGLVCSWQILIGISVLFAFFGVVFRLRSNKRTLENKTNNNVSIWIVASYLILGIVVTLNMFVGPLDGPESYQQTFDNPNHLTLIQSIISSGVFSPLFADYYPDVSTGIFAGGSSFYPSMWHIVAAILVASLGISVPMAANVVVTVFTGIIFPLSICFMLSKLFLSKRLVALGAVLPLSFLAFPWVFYWAGPLYPNAASFCVAPLVAGLFIKLMQEKSTLLTKMLNFFLVLCGIIVLLFLHPNAIFMLIVFFVPYCVSNIFCAFKNKSTKDAYAAALLFLVCVIIIWVVLYKLPILQGTVTYSWDSFATPAQALINIVLYSFRYEGVQPLLSFIVLVGIFCLLKRKQHRWLVVSYVVFCLFYFITATTESFIKSFLTGFWYTDPNRVAACIVFCAIPLACVGLDGLLSIFMRKVLSCWELSKVKQNCLNIIVVIVFLVANFYPSFIVYGITAYSSPFTTYKQAMSNLNNGNVHYSYTPEEQDFVEDCLEVLPKNSLVANFPYDGSSMAYGINGASVVFRAYYDSNYKGYPELRKDLNCVEESVDVQSFLRESNIEYLILLDYAEDFEEGSFAFCEDAVTRSKQWSGILSIRDDTPGFEVVLARDDMRLYKINF